MSAKHTPGPWRFFSGSRSIRSIRSDGGKAICSVHGPRKAPADYELAELQANATLIAAAPDTAAAAMAFTMLVEAFVRGADTGAEAVTESALATAMYALRAHIAEATGAAS